MRDLPRLRPTIHKLCPARTCSDTIERGRLNPCIFQWSGDYLRVCHGSPWWHRWQDRSVQYLVGLLSVSFLLPNNTTVQLLNAFFVPTARICPVRYAVSSDDEYARLAPHIPISFAAAVWLKSSNYFGALCANETHCECSRTLVSGSLVYPLLHSDGLLAMCFGKWPFELMPLLYRECLQFGESPKVPWASSFPVSPSPSTWPIPVAFTFPACFAVRVFTPVVTSLHAALCLQSVISSHALLY